jgi:hypothetical protein
MIFERFGVASAPPAVRRAPDDVWLHHIAPDQRHQVVCIQCWRRLTEAIDGGA